MVCCYLIMKLNYVNENLLHSIKVKDARYKENGCSNHSRPDERPWNRGSQKTRTKALNHADNGIQGIDQTVIIRYGGRRINNRSRVHQHPEGKRHGELHIPEPDRHGRQPNTDTGSNNHHLQHEQGQKKEVPRRRDAVISDD